MYSYVKIWFQETYFAANSLVGGLSQWVFYSCSSIIFQYWRVKFSWKILFDLWCSCFVGGRLPLNSWSAVFILHQSSEKILANFQVIWCCFHKSFSCQYKGFKSYSDIQVASQFEVQVISSWRNKGLIASI